MNLQCILKLTLLKTSYMNSSILGEKWKFWKVYTKLSFPKLNITKFFTSLCSLQNLHNLSVLNMRLGNHWSFQIIEIKHQTYNYLKIVKTQISYIPMIKVLMIQVNMLCADSSTMEIWFLISKVRRSWGSNNQR